MDQLETSRFLSQMNLDSVVIFDAANGAVSDLDASRENLGVLLLGQKDKIDYLNGRSGDDFVEGFGQRDIISGGAGSDTLDGGAGDDILRGDGGNDVIYGGSGYDTARYDQNRNQYDVQVHQSGNTERITIAPNVGALQYEGTDTLFQVENFVFNGVSYTREQLIQSATGSGGATDGNTYDDDAVTNPGAVSGDLPNNTSTPVGAFLVAGTASTSGIPFTNAIETSGDTDYVRVYLQQDFTYRFLVDGVSVGSYSPLQDTFFRIRDGRDLRADPGSS